ncbi:hypothetical protein NBE99_09175 [Thermosynechococcus sp. HN-54]|uniref:hypothetical protein n=1 Tax=Thermosynechococcus sp. HN-54 TaxID=2933959 RepID=UPI00202CD5DD|nr:hypothetical protein [Thermosynechococcus sp. HN-54]URR34813.1 hypothetical protein NBE99_09175 [Thermosynechococcus sp. HN-54]
MKTLQGGLGAIVLGVASVLPAAAETLVSDSGLTQIYDYQFTHFPGDVLSYTTKVNGRVYEGTINVTAIGNGFVRGFFSDRDLGGNFGCSGEVTIQWVRDNRYISVWRVGGTYTPRLQCPQAGTTARLNMRLYP